MVALTSPVVEQRAPASGCRDLPAAAGRHRVEGAATERGTTGSRPAPGCRLAVVEEARQPSGGRAASASERVSRPPRSCGSSLGRKTQHQGKVRRGSRSAPGWRLAVVEEARQRRLETTTSTVARNFRNTSPQPPGIPHSGPGTVGGGCQNSLYGNGIRRHRATPGHVHDRRHLPPAPRGRRPRTVDPPVRRDRRPT